MEEIWQHELLKDAIIKLIPLAETDFDKLFEVASDPLIWEQHPSNDRYQKDVFQLFFKDAIASKSGFLIIDNATDSIIGSTRYYNYNPENQSIAIGFTFLARKFWGGIHNKSAKKLLIDYAFQKVDTIFFHIGSTNFRSQIATAKIGAKKIREFSVETNNQKQITFEFAIQKKDWKF